MARSTPIDPNSTHRVTEINRVLLDLHKLWTTCPNLRLGQIMATLVRNAEKRSEAGCPCSHYLLDRDIEDGIRKWLVELS